MLYFFWISLTVSLCLVWIVRRSSDLKFPVHLALELTGWLLVAIPLGARLFHVVYEQPSYYAEQPLRILEVWSGGFVYYGGWIAGLLVTGLFFRTPRERSFWQTADFLSPVLSFGSGIGRFACFLQGCCYGQEWTGLLSIQGRHPAQLYQMFWDLGVGLLLLILEKKKSLHTGVHFGLWLLLSGVGRFAVEFFRADFRGYFLMGLSISQWIALGIMVVGLAILKTRRQAIRKL
ncbi:MAG: prolipoprotein diacylglyceryl transferase [Bdellovibrionales bacterium]